VKRRTLYWELNNPEGYRKLDAFEQMARRLMREHGLSEDWEFLWSRDRLVVRTLACCTFYANGVIKGSGGFLFFSRTIVLRSEEKQRATILHEIAHALLADKQPLRMRLRIHNHKRTTRWESHGADWAEVAREIGMPAEHLARYETPEGT